MRPLNLKLLRDLWGIRGQAIAIAAVMGAGVAMFVLMLSTYDSLDVTQRTYYDRYRFADVFASLKRAPTHLLNDIRAIPGVADAHGRVVVDVNLDVPGLSEPALGRLISIPERRREVLCDVFLREGRWIDPAHPDEVLISETFAQVNGLRPGDRLAAVINGRRRQLRVVGLALSPEYVYAIRPGEVISDDRLFGVMWMGHRALATAFDMEGGFNDVVVKRMHGASERDVIARLDRVLEPYGGLGAMPRSLQPSHFYLQSELDSLQGMGAIVPIVFLAVAAFLLSVVLSRIVTVQREQIAALKALGYSNVDVAWHYIQWGLIVSVAGIALGLLAGAWLGRGMTRIYADFYHFPILEYRLTGGTIARAVLVSLLAGTFGGLAAFWRVVRLPPAEAMRPEPPASYNVSWIERAGLKRWLSQPARMMLRNLARHPGRVALSVTGIAAGGAMLIVGAFTLDSIDELMDLQFNVAQRFDASVAFVEPVSAEARGEVARLPGVIFAEGYRATPVRLRLEHRSRNAAIIGLPHPARLQRVVDASYALVELPPEGLVISSKLAELLGAEIGDAITVEVLEGKRPVRRIPLTGVVDDYMGVSAYMRKDALHRFLREGNSLSGAYLLVDPSRLDTLYHTVKNLPKVAGVTLKGAAIRSFQDTIAETIGITRTVTILFAAIIAFGVVYNAARVSLSERSRELATLRVIGFTRAEISYILLGELAIVTLLAIPVCMLLGYGLAALVVRAFDTEVYRLPLIISARTYTMSVVVVVVAAAVSGWVVRRKLDHLDLISVLKTSE